MSERASSVIPWKRGDGPDVATLDALTAAVEAGPNPRARRLLALYFGLHGAEPHSLTAIGLVEGFSRERARQWIRREVAWLGTGGVHPLV